jgi:hypothetical protein
MNKTYVLFAYTNRAASDTETGITVSTGYVTDCNSTPIQVSGKVQLAEEYASEASADTVAWNLRNRGYTVEVKSYRKR